MDFALLVLKRWNIQADNQMIGNHNKWPWIPEVSGVDKQHIYTPVKK